MKIITAENIGFCHGVQRAYDMVENALIEYGSVYTYGDIIHNKGVVYDLKQRGATPVKSLDGLYPGDRVVIRSHGVPPQFYDECKQRGIEYIDATCPFVSRIHKAVTDMHGQGYTIVIAGKSDHPEVIGTNGYCENTAVILDSPEKAGQLGSLGRVFIVAQTTIIPAVFMDIAAEVGKHAEEIKILNSICNATELRQNEARQIATKCDMMIVIGGKHSSNTVKLLQICKEVCKNAYIIESTDDVDIENLNHDDIIGVVAGASTPQWSIREVIASMYEKDQKLTGTEEQNVTEPVNDSEQIETSATELTAEQPVAEEAVEAQPEPAAEQPQQPQAEEKPEEPSAEEQPETDEAAEQASEGEEAEKAEEKATEEPERELTPEESFERDLEKTMVRIRPRQVKKGTVVQIAGDDVFVNIGYKADGIIPQAELSTDPKAVASEMLEVGDEVTVEILKVNDGEGNVLLSKRIVDKRNEDKQAIAELEDGQPFEVRIRQAVKGGLLGEYRGARVFIPASHASDKFVENLDEFAGQTFKVKALEVDKSKRRVVASRKQVVQDEAIEARKKRLEAFQPGQRLKGTVRRITDFGAFTDIGGIDGLIHVTDLSWGRVKHPSDVVSVGDELEVEVLSVTPETERISLGLKQLMPKPWDSIEERYFIGDIVEGKVDRIAPFGAFVELEPGLFGLVHISQVATRRIEKVEDELRVGDVIAVKVLDINTENRRISLSRRAVLQEDRPQHVEKGKRDSDEHIKYEIPPMESASVTLGDFFPKDELVLADDNEEE